MDTQNAATAPPAASDSPLSFERLVFFSDAVFAIVITLLVLPLAVDVELPESDGGLAYQVWALWPKGLTFVIAFLVIGQFWMAHHRMFSHLNRFDQGLLWANLICLMTVCFMPFPAALLGSVNIETDHFAVIFFAASMSVVSIAMSATWVYAVKRGLVEPSQDSVEISEFTARSFATTAVFVLSIGLAFLGLWAATLCWLVLLPFVRVAVGRIVRRRATASGA